ncbi:MAG TPA: formimidoylglutamate deiminase [Acidothermaceae bacterium]
MTTWWCEHASLPDGVADDVLIETEDGIFAAISLGIAPPADATRLRGLVIPGLANTHSHAFHRALRGRTQQGAGDFWAWRNLMYDVAARLDPDSYYALSRAVYAEMTLAGITCVGEFHYLHHAPGGTPYNDPNAMGHALMHAAASAGARLTLLDTCYLAGGFNQPLRGPQLRFGDGSAGSWAVRVEQLSKHVGVRVGAAIHSVRAVPLAEAEVAAAAAKRNDWPLHMHVSEQVAENEQCLERYDRTPTQVFADVGALTANSTAVHATHLTSADIALLSKTGCGVCLCPTTERDLADGIGPAGTLATQGVPLSLGSDSQAVVDLLEEARGVEMHERLATHRRGGFDPPALLRMATQQGHRALGWSNAGAIALGMRADLVAVDLESVRTAGAGATLGAVVFAATAADVTDVVIDDRHVVRDRRHLLIEDVSRELAASITAVLP